MGAAFHVLTYLIIAKSNSEESYNTAGWLSIKFLTYKNMIEKMDNFRSLLTNENKLYLKQCEIIDWINAHEEKHTLQQKNESWPQNTDKYYYLNSDGEIVSTYWATYTKDLKRLEIGNCFKTEEEANLASGRVKKAYKNV